MPWINKLKIKSKIILVFTLTKGNKNISFFDGIKLLPYFKYEFLKSETIAASKCEGICILRSVLSPSFVNFFSWFS